MSQHGRLPRMCAEGLRTRHHHGRVLGSRSLSLESDRRQAKRQHHKHVRFTIPSSLTRIKPALSPHRGYCPDFKAQPNDDVINGHEFALCAPPALACASWSGSQNSRPNCNNAQLIKGRVGYQTAFTWQHQSTCKWVSLSED